MSLGIGLSTLKLGGGMPPLWEIAFVNGTLPGNITFTRASSATRDNPSGVKEVVGTDVARFDTNPSTLAPRGLLVEGARTNSIRNSTMQGAAVGTAPTYWSANGNSANGITLTYTGVGTENGFSYVDVRLSGTTVGTSGYAIQFESAGAIASSNTQYWTQSKYIRLVSGSLANITGIVLNANQYNSSSTYLATLFGSNVLGQVSSTVARVSQTLTTNQATVAFVTPKLAINAGAGAVIDATFRIYGVQLEQGSFATSYIPTTGTAATQAVDNLVISNLASIGFKPSGSTVVIEWERESITSDAGRVLWSIYTAANQFNNRLWVEVGTAGTDVKINKNNNGTWDVFLLATGAPTTTNKLAVSFKDGEIKICLNGGAVATSTAGTLPTGLDRMSIGHQAGGVSAFSWIRGLKVIPNISTDAELQRLTQ